MGHAEAFDGKIQATGDFAEMKEVDVEAPQVTSGATDAPAPAIECRKNCRKKCLIAAFVLIALLVVSAVAIGTVAADDDDDDMDDRNKMCEKLARRGPKGGMKSDKQMAQHRSKGGRGGRGGRGDDDDDDDAKKFCMLGGKICGSSLMLTNKETQEEKKMTVYADEGGVLEVAESLKEKYDVSEPIPLSCAKPKGPKGRKGGKGRQGRKGDEEDARDA